jgi:hypothetical protein
MTRKKATPYRSELDWIDLLGGILKGTPSMTGAACKGQHRIWLSDDPALIEKAADICRTACPVFAQCSAWAQNLRHDEIDGVIGGEHREWHHRPGDLVYRQKQKENRRKTA